MIKTINFYEFSDWFIQSDTYKNNFSYEGLRALFDHLEQYEEDVGEPIEFDPIAICCEYSEYNNLKEIKNNYTNIKTRQQLEDNTTVIDCDNGHLIIQNF